MAVTQENIQKTQTRYFVLHPYVFLVSGIKRGALYDLHRNRMLPLPESARYIVDLCEQHKPVQEASTVRGGPCEQPVHGRGQPGHPNVVAQRP